MKKFASLVTVLITVTQCTYRPVVDTAGRSGTHGSDQAREITNDLQHCEQLAAQHNNKAVDGVQQAVNWYFSTATLGIIPRKESAYRASVRRCLQGRGHSVIK